MISDEALFERFQKGDRMAFNSLLERYQDGLYQFLFRYTAHATTAEEVFQETFIKVWQRQDQFETGRKFKPWLFQIAANTAKDKFRSHARRAEVLDDNLEQHGRQSHTPTPAQHMEQKDLVDKIKQAVQTLPEQYRDVFILRQYDNLSYQEISDVLDRPLNTVKSDMRRALQQLRGLLDNLAGLALEGGAA